MFEVVVILCLASDMNECRQLSKMTEDCVVEIQKLKEELPIKDGLDGEGELILKAFACVNKEKPKLTT